MNWPRRDGQVVDAAVHAVTQYVSEDAVPAAHGDTGLSGEELGDDGAAIGGQHPPVATGR
ncbi:hypothetical protein [Mycobacterium kansasii]|uniref:hypothetical protein n=1 Tax=Mycobacterium kansasii TaxID=1768 RepID=UPI0012BC8A25|nr:hypothetical protein [Mycobacterium kansasii]UCA22990.1 hypothetical protein LA359_29370 [Mycobacterium kansasii]